MALADLLHNTPDLHRHNGKCCWVRRGGDDMATVFRLLDMTGQWPHHDLAVALTREGYDVDRQSVYRHRATGCKCCGYAGAKR